MKRACFGLAMAFLFFSLPVVGQSIEEDLPASDTRLDLKLRVESDGIALSDLLARISREAGISLQADRETRDDKVTLFGPARPLRDTLADLAELFGHRWLHSKEQGSERYILVKQSSVRQRENELANAVARQIQAQLDAQTRALNETPERLAKRAEDDPLRRFLSEPKSRLAIQLYSRLDSRQRETFTEKGRLRLFYASLSPALQKALFAYAPSAPPASGAIPGGLPPARTAGSPEGPSRRLTETVTARSAPPDLEFLLNIRPDGTVLAMMRPPASVLFADFKTRPVSLPLQCNPYTGQTLGKDAALPDVKAIPERATEDWVRKLQRLSEAANVPVMADYYRLRGIPPVAKESLLGGGAYGALTVFAAWDGYLWWTHGKTILFRKRDWFLRRQYEVPDRWLAQASKALQEQEGKPTYADVQRAVELTPKQLIGLANLHTEKNGTLPYAFASDEEYQAGLAELLQMVNEKASPRGRNSTGLANYDTLSQEDLNRAIEAATLTFEEMTFAQKRLIPAFLAAQSRQVAGAESEKFAFHLRTYNPTQGSRKYRYVWIEIRWQSRQTGVQGEYRLPLPLSLPDDRRAGTIVAREE